MTENLKTPEDIKQELIKKLKRVCFIVKEINQPIRPNHLREITSIVNDFLIDYSNNQSTLRENIPLLEFHAFQSAYNHAYMLALALNNVTFNDENIAVFPADFNNHVDWMRTSFEEVLYFEKEND